MRKESHSFVKSAIVAGAVVASVLGAGAAQAYQITQSFNQGESRDGGGRVTVEASTIHVTNCNGAGENRGTFYIYQYLKRPGFRAILPPNWAHPIGGHDVGSFAEAAHVACVSH